MTVVETNVWDGRTLTVTWDDSQDLPPLAQTTQASGVCFTDAGQIVLIGSGNGRWSLPGGHPEDGETAQEALIREVMEEACAVVERCEYLGAQIVEDPAEDEAYYQTRWWARVTLLPFEPLYEITEREMVEPEEFVRVLGWDTARIAQAILDAALASEENEEACKMRYSR